MCRSMSTQTVLFDHISFEEDAIGIVFCKSKTDQSGEKSRDPRHLYANPFQPATCVILALGVYLASHPQLASGQLFPGGTQRDRFGKSLARLVATSFNSDSATIGTHSIRKGVATFACSGSTSGPSMASVCLRCGWTLGHVLERYVHYERAGDQYLGRIVAGLPNHKAEFAILPPHFPPNIDDEVRSAMDLVFPRLSQEIHLFGVLSFALASLVYHSDFLVQLLPQKHPLMSSSIFANTTMLSRLKSHVTLSSSRITPTGIPPHVDLFKAMERNHTAIQEIPNVISDKLETIFQEHGVSSGNITRQYLESALSNFVERIAPRPHSPLVVMSTTQNSVLHNWGGRLAKLPMDFEFPSVDPASAWRLWWLGNDSRSHPPYRFIVPLDLSSTTQRKVLSSWKFVMSEFERVSQSSGLVMPRRPTEEDVKRLYEPIALYIQNICSATTRKRTCRPSQLRLVSLVRVVRAARSLRN